MKEPEHAGMGKEFPHTDLILLMSALLFSVVWILDSFVFRFLADFTGFVPDVLRILLFTSSEVSAIVLGFYSHNVLFSKQGKEFTLAKSCAHPPKNQ